MLKILSQYFDRYGLYVRISVFQEDTVYVHLRQYIVEFHPSLEPPFKTVAR
ncbi:GL15574 [Drosophila persimilis]|uniref:GL15574 n=1 Tax=Drosophila persimilis TaxID=7234 RepID=B4H6K3_DROPE|nr:GL15574 [Drosophila persimilis]